MSFREKSSWITFAALTIMAYFYFSYVWGQSDGFNALIPPNLPVLFKYSIGFIVLLILLHIVGAAMSPKEADAALDEREKQIMVIASHYSGLIFAFAVVTALVQFVINPGNNGNLLFYSVLAGLIVSQLCESLITIYFHRRGI